jgi:transcription elongation GreA/GreB family factor
MDSPLAKALLKKQVDDEIQVTLAEKTVALTILSIHYEQHQ